MLRTLPRVVSSSRSRPAPALVCRLFNVSHAPRGTSCGIVGLPNVGKSCLFNALIGEALARSENYPFCTINPTKAKAPYVDARLKTLSKIVNPNRTIGTTVDFVDIAGLVEGASEGHGLGNQFLEHVRSVSVILHLVRCFEDAPGTHIAHVMRNVNPVRDVKLIEKELVLKDIQLLDVYRKTRGSKNLPFDGHPYAALAQKIYDALSSDSSIAEMKIKPSSLEGEMLAHMRLLSAKPVVYVANVDEAALSGENDHLRSLRDLASSLGRPVIAVSAPLEFELASLKDDEAIKEFRDGYGLDPAEVGVGRVIEECFTLLGQQVFFTQGPQEVRSWTVKRGSTARECSGVIHSDFVKNFIKAEHWSYDEFVRCNGKRVRTVFKPADYIAQDGDIFEFKIR